MEISLAHQFAVALSSVVLGLLFGLIYDCVRILRCFLGIRYKRYMFKRLKCIDEDTSVGKAYESIVMGITDIIYFVTIAVIMSVFVYFVNNGKIRWYIYFGAFFGFMLYYFTLGRVVISLSSLIVIRIRKIFKIILVCLFEPIRPVALWLKAAFCKIKRTYVKNRIKKHEKEDNCKRNILMEYGKRL